MSSFIQKVLFQAPSTYLGEIGLEFQNSAAGSSLRSTASSLSHRFSFLTNPRWLPYHISLYSQRIASYCLPALSLTASVIPLYQYVWQWRNYASQQSIDAHSSRSRDGVELNLDPRGGGLSLEHLQVKVDQITKEMGLKSYTVAKGKNLSRRVESIGKFLLVRPSDLGAGRNDSALELSIRMELFRANYHFEAINHSLNLAVTLGTVALSGVVPGWIFIAAQLTRFVLERLAHEHFARASIHKMKLKDLKSAGERLIDDNRERINQMRPIYTHIDKVKPSNSYLPSSALSLYSHVIGFFNYLKSEVDEARISPSIVGMGYKLIRTSISVFHFIVRDRKGDYRVSSFVQNGHLIELINKRLPQNDQLEILT